ncbi:hypothetical protein [Yoonia vestfoldensis]|jgi:hypothetical protein|uniref:Uncharacterized protein n=1 Tax=Yoonia vestfoldensis TaxID=245188 RepID=A0A1Y0EAC4_9RHOB|nr:hypothetical protein [Yoonia vestfoldensis]ARU00301.1 hypothetical protein LOKVESSMR4R_00971 [Yoonia vestfoldensis]
MAGTKIATCCYCGTRAALVLRGQSRHELSCSNCGAPLHAMKMLPSTPAPARQKRPYTPPHPERMQPARPQKRRKGKSFGRKVFSELWDIIEDVFD